LRPRKSGGWIAFDIRETFLDTSDRSGFSRTVRDDCLKLHHLERQRHGLSIKGNMLYYYAIVGQKRRDIGDACLAGL